MTRRADAARREKNREDDWSTLSFEQILERLKDVVETLEAGDAPLEEALATFERGVALSRVGAQRLDEAERRVEVLLRNGRTRPFSDNPDDVSADAVDEERTDDER